MCKSDPILTVCIITFNHSKFIQKALDSVINQKVNFTYKILVADDCSTDSTRTILEEYRAKYPNLINLILQNINIGAAENWKQLITTPLTKYIAYFEGDDYWIDPHKLQKQIDFLEHNLDYYLVVGNTVISQNDKISIHNWRGIKYKCTEFTVSDYIENSFFHTSSACFRRSPFFPVNRITDFLQGDFYLYLFMSEPGCDKIKFMDDLFSCYRIHDKSITKESKNNNISIALPSLIKLYQYFDGFSNYIYSKQVEKKVRRIQLGLEYSQQSYIGKFITLMLNLSTAYDILKNKILRTVSNILTSLPKSNLNT